MWRGVPFGDRLDAGVGGRRRRPAGPRRSRRSPMISPIDLVGEQRAALVGEREVQRRRARSVTVWASSSCWTSWSMTAPKSTSGGSCWYWGGSCAAAMHDLAQRDVGAVDAGHHGVAGHVRPGAASAVAASAASAAAAASAALGGGRPRRRRGAVASAAAASVAAGGLGRRRFGGRRLVCGAWRPAPRRAGPAPGPAPRRCARSMSGFSMERSLDRAAPAGAALTAGPPPLISASGRGGGDSPPPRPGARGPQGTSSHVGGSPGRARLPVGCWQDEDDDHGLGHAGAEPLRHPERPQGQVGAPAGGGDQRPRAAGRRRSPTRA